MIGRRGKSKRPSPPTNPMPEPEDADARAIARKELLLASERCDQAMRDLVAALEARAECLRAAIRLGAADASLGRRQLLRLPANRAASFHGLPRHVEMFRCNSGSRRSFVDQARSVIGSGQERD